MTKFSGWMFTDARKFMECPKCHAKAGEYCVTPKGRKTGGGIPHSERTEALVKKYGVQRWQHKGVGIINF